MINIFNPDYSNPPGRRAVPSLYNPEKQVGLQVFDISIITPYYNTEELFHETVISLKAQSLQNWEWLIVDDGSSDQSSVNRLTKVAAKDKRIKVIRQVNAGPSAARNTAFSHSSGRYLCLLDSDDMVEPTYLEKCVWFLDSYPEFSFCNTYNVVFGEQEYLWTPGFDRGKAFVQSNSGPPISVIRRQAYEDCGGFDESIRFGHEDWDFWLAMAKAGHWGYTIPEFLQWYRRRCNGRFEQIMRSGNVNEDFRNMMYRKYEGLEEHFPEPTRRHPLPYENIASDSLVNNSLVANPHGRRILFIVPWMVTGGADRVNLDLIEGLSTKGHEITVCATLLADHCWEYQFSRFTSDIFILPNFLHVSDYPRFLLYLVRSRKIDTVLITGSTIGYQLLPYLRTMAPEVAFLDMCHVEEPHWLNGGHPRFGVGYQDMLDLNIVTTGHLAAWMQERGADSERIRVMYTGVRSRQEANIYGIRETIRRELQIPADVPVIIFAGRICAQKRPAILADILRQAHDSGLVFRALIIGEGELKAELENLLKQGGLADIVLMLGSVSHERWLDLLFAADILLMPSQYEGISIALLESMATGVVPVVANVGGQDEIVNPEVGILVTHGTNELQEYTGALRSLLSDPEKLARMSRQCKVLSATKLSWKGMIDHFETIIKEAHRLREKEPRSPVSPGLAKELVAQSLECKRLGESVDFLWKKQAQTANDWWFAMSAETQAVAGLAVRLSQTRMGQRIIHNRFFKCVGRKILKGIGH